MNTFVNAVANQEARTLNDMKARLSTANAAVDLFYAIGASRGQDILPKFIAAYVDNEDVALRIAQWARDVRGGAGERQLYRNIMVHLESVGHWANLLKMMEKTATIGRWDDLLIFNTEKGKRFAYNIIAEALRNGNGLCGKWMPRKGQIAAELRTYMRLSPKTYRKTLVELTKVVETQMCDNEWDGINFSAVPSVAHNRYKKAFARHTPNYAEYVEKLVKGDASVKVNVGALYPHDVLGSLVMEQWENRMQRQVGAFDYDMIIQQWNALETFMGDASVLPMVDTSGSMYTPIGNKSNVTAMEVAVSLGLYMADKNKGAFKDTFLTFSTVPQLVTLKGNIVDKVKQMVTSKWAMNTNLIAAIEKILQVAIDGKVPQEDMPKMLVILSDMQFDSCARFDDSAMEAIYRRYEAAGYNAPLIVFWNLHNYDNVPAKFNDNGVALISGFSPSIMKSVLSCDTDAFTPVGIMMRTIMVDRYNLG